MSFTCDNIDVNAEGHLSFAGQDTVLLAKEYGTPLYLMDENRIRMNCAVYRDAFAKYFPEGSRPLYASKACCFMELYRIIGSESFGADVVSPGEIYTAKKAGFDLSLACYHSNDKTGDDIRYAMKAGVGSFVLESIEEAYAVDAIAKELKMTQRVLIRITPGIDTHTYVAVNTGLVDSKFGVPIETGQADQLTKTVLKLKHLRLAGFHCHVGSEVFEENVFERTAAIMISYIGHVRDSFGYQAEVLNLGGGYGVRYVHSDPYLDISEKIRLVAETINRCCKKLGLPFPLIEMEPGRSIVADAGMTLYTVGSRKMIPGYKNYVSVDGGMTDNPRFALYKARYSCFDASRMNEKTGIVCDVVGRCCESGDIIQPNVAMPEKICRGDILAVATTGAYNYAMASNYNRIPRPAVVILKNGSSRLAVRRETLDDLTALDI